MIWQILLHTPRFVWVLLVVVLALGALGALGLRPRRMALSRAVPLPLAMLAWSLATLAMRAQQAPGLALLWLGAALPGAALAWQVAPARRAALAEGGRHVLLPGSVQPLLAMLAIFVANYLAALSRAIGQAQPQLAWLGVAGLAVSGLVSGYFAGSLARLLQRVRMLRRATSSG